MTPSVLLLAVMLSGSLSETLPMTGLPPAKVAPNLSVLTYRVTTDSADCQTLFNQGLAYLYAQKWQEAAQALETATLHDASCAMVWWGLSRALEQWGKDNHSEALKKAQELMPGASDRERLLITARLQDKGVMTGGRKAAQKSLDDLLTLYYDDEEGWFYRGQLSDAGVQQVPYYKALLRLNPLHPGANLELARFYESDKGAILARYHTDSYKKSSPGIHEAKPGPLPKEPDFKPVDLSAANVKLPICGLSPARITPGLCLTTYRISTTSPECQAHFDQGLGYYYSYVWMEAARSFETAIQHDPTCAIAWWGLSRALEKWGRANANQSLEKAQQLLHRAPLRERLLIIARLQEKGMFPGATPENRRTAAAKTLDELIAIHEEDQEAWYNRAQVSETGVNRIPFYKALTRINPLHAGGTHELLHFYENYRRPALGWIYAENYIKSSPLIPHPFHMQAHLATRLGRWDKTSDRSARAIELERAYHKEMNVTPKQDHQYGHHLEILTVSLVHDGRFKEARAIKEEALRNSYRHAMPWFKLHLGERDWAEALKIVEQQRKTDATTANYLAALVYLKQGDTKKAGNEIDALRKAAMKSRTDRRLEARLWETDGWFQCQEGDADAGLKLLQQAVDRTKNDYAHHAWGNGAIYMETWGIAALQAKRYEVAEEAFLEALAHDPGSVRAALGLQVTCERLDRQEEAGRYAEIARRCWKKADPGKLEAELAWLRTELPSPERVPPPVELK